ncbi:hypothetical protein L873DRAFT_1819714 [Choiromyces venosus 120613-1]|uniref:Uncharacterized protein n=1 Tax=Choiromyces venosus 120613-1 TaxID=1336337 RepID=A0A3N4J2D2_9PEZI|nr:hypothetical protein L873DRAFT_1819714 [Choiromyces venosus 120613-1]
MSGFLFFLFYWIFLLSFFSLLSISFSMEEGRKGIWRRRRCNSTSASGKEACLNRVVHFHSLNLTSATMVKKKGWDHGTSEVL